MKRSQHILRAVLFTLIVSFGAVHRLQAAPPWTCTEARDGQTWCEGCEICTQEGYELDYFECMNFGGNHWHWYHEIWIFDGDQEGWETCDAAEQFCNLV